MTASEDPSLFRSDRSGIRKLLGDLEAEIMELIWAQPAEKGITVREVFEILYERRKLAYTTVMNTMTRLGKKRVLRVEKQGLAYRYYPMGNQQAFITGSIYRLVEELLVSFSGEMPGMETTGLQDPCLQALLDEARRRGAEEEEHP